MAGKKQQMQMYPLEKMGILISPTMIQLWGSFIRDKLAGGPLDAHPDWKEEGEVTDVGCPFCKNGFLKLVKVEPRYSGGIDPVPLVKELVANKYEYVCSNGECNGRFFGEYQWKWID